MFRRFFSGKKAMINKIVSSLEEAMTGLIDGMTVLVGGFGEAGSPLALLPAVLDCGARDLTIVSNNAGRGEVGIAALILNRRVRRIICSFPTIRGNHAVRNALEKSELELELCPQGSLAERIRAAGSGLGGVLTSTGIGTPLAMGKPLYEIDGRQFLVERPIHGDFALIRAWTGDRWGNLRYRYAQQNFNPVMAMAAKCTVAEVDNIVELGELVPMDVHTPGIFVSRLLQVQQTEKKE